MLAAGIINTQFVIGQCSSCTLVVVKKQFVYQSSRMNVFLYIIFVFLGLFRLVLEALTMEL